MSAVQALQLTMPSDQPIGHGAATQAQFGSSRSLVHALEQLGDVVRRTLDYIEQLRMPQAETASPGR